VIVRLLVGMARAMFTVGLLLLAAGGLALYGAYRLLRAVTVGAPPTPKRDAAFQTMQALVTLANTLRATAGKIAPELELELELDDDGTAPPRVVKTVEGIPADLVNAYDERIPA
jgi:hypothetical protein